MGHEGFDYLLFIYNILEDSLEIVSSFGRFLLVTGEFTTALYWGLREFLDTEIGLLTIFLLENL